MIEDYIIKENIPHPQYEIFKAIKIENQSPVIIKTTKTLYPTQEEINQIEREYNIGRHLDVDGIIKPYGLEKYGNRPVLILEYFNGIMLKTILSDRSPLSLQEFFNLSIEIINTIANIHANKVFHRNLNPYNILVNSAMGAKKIVKITDMSLSTYIGEPSKNDDKQYIGSFAYISPEQTGRLDMRPDHRSDLYALGIIFYEMLTGRHPFEQDGPLELIHCHLTTIPEPLHIINSDIPVVISKIINKLLSKHPIDRYQSAYGLRYDIERCLKTSVSGKIKSFKLGTSDTPDMIAPMNNYGRSSELKELISIIKRVMEGGFEAVFIKGSAGIGKSTLIEEFQRKTNSRFISSKYDQFQSNIPLKAIRAAFTSFTRNILGKGDAEIEELKTRILDNVGEYSRILTDIIPELIYIIGEQPDVPYITADKAQNRLHYIFQRFLEVIIDKDHPLIIFLDDIHWADLSSLHLIEYLLNTRLPYY